MATLRCAAKCPFAPDSNSFVTPSDTDSDGRLESSVTNQEGRFVLADALRLLLWHVNRTSPNERRDRPVTKEFSYRTDRAAFAEAAKRVVIAEFSEAL
jgi:hypothetical protein